MREPAYSGPGNFYSSEPEKLSRQLEGFFQKIDHETLPIVGAVVPHAGYEYSGAVAAEVYARIPKQETYVIIGPNHSDPRNLTAAMSRDSWRTPLGTLQVDQELAEALANSIIDADEIMHRDEHSIEVQLPFLQHRFSDFKILPISMGWQDPETANEVGQAVGKAVKDLKRRCTIIASSDMTHQKPKEIAQKGDFQVIEAILNMDVPELYRRISNYKVSACGYGPIAATIVASHILGATIGKLQRYATSGDVTRDFSHVVGYGAITFS